MKHRKGSFYTSLHINKVKTHKCVSCVSCYLCSQQLMSSQTSFSLKCACSYLSLHCISSPHWPSSSCKATLSLTSMASLTAFSMCALVHSCFISNRCYMPLAPVTVHAVSVPAVLKSKHGKQHMHLRDCIQPAKPCICTSYGKSIV